MEDTVIDSSSVVTSQDDGSEPTSVHTSFISTSSSISTQSVSDGTAIVAHSSTTEEVEDMYDSVISEIGAKEITEDNVDPLVEALKEFHNTCRNTNQLMQVLLRSDIRHTHPPGKPEESAGREESDSDDSSSTHSSEDPRDESQVKEEPKYFDTLQRNVKDIRKLRRFIDHIRKNIKHIDCYRKAKEVRRKLFVKAQRLAKARRRMKHDEAALSDVMDDIADIIQSDIDAAADEDDVVDDISVALSAEASDSIMDEVDDDLYGSVAGEDDIADEVQDEVVDGSQSSAFDEVGDEAVVGAESEQSWGEVESEFAAALAEASDVEDLLEDEVPLDDEIPVDEVASAAVRTDESVGDDVVIDDEGVDDVVDDVEDAVPSMESIEESDAEDADVSTVLPISSDSSRSTSTDQRAASVARAYDDTESAESALDALERDMAETAGYRAHLVTTITPTTFTEMYVPDARSTDVHIAGDEAKSLLSDSVDVKSLAAVDRVSTTLTTWPRLEAFVASPSNSVSPVEQSVAQQSATTGASSASVAGLPRQTSRRSAYPTDDLLAQVAWKERQLRLFEKIRPKPELALEETEEPQDEAEGFVEGRAEYHWSMLETLLQHRFGSGGGIADGLDDYSDEYESDEDDHSYDAYGSSLSGAFAGLSARGGVRDGVLADAEYSGK
uniref:Uncharacterized protein TCIL3000_11_2070 n=1 Tax=Trypanosoma congolense (strain IL3000) TaxID=1068625 RepID=G0UZK0_TRYCI|nr:unnamed protein product [Trypanosoma congolense IL3000]